MELRSDACNTSATAKADRHRGCLNAPRACAARTVRFSRRVTYGCTAQLFQTGTRWPKGFCEMISAT